MSLHEWIERGSISDDIAKRKGVRELIRCKDCRHLEHLYWLDEKNGKKCYVCKKHNFTGLRDENWFCADGKRKEGR